MVWKPKHPGILGSIRQFKGRDTKYRIKIKALELSDNAIAVKKKKKKLSVQVAF